MLRERKAAPSLLASPAALPPQRALSHPPPYLLSAFPTEGVKPTVVCSTPVETKAPTSSAVQKRRVTPNPLPPALPTGPWEGHGSAGHGAPIPSLPLAWGALRMDQTQQRGVPAPRARSSSSRRSPRGCRSQAQAAPCPAAVATPGWVFLPSQPRFSSELALASSSTAPACPRHNPPTLAASTPLAGHRSTPRAQPLPGETGPASAKRHFTFLLLFFPPSSFSFLFFFLSTWHASLSPPLTQSGFQLGEHRNGLIISDEESVCSIRQRRVIIHL